MECSSPGNIHPHSSLDVKKQTQIISFASPLPTSQYAYSHSTADPRSDENSDKILNLVLITESVKLLECQKDNDWEANFVWLCYRYTNDKDDEYCSNKCCFRFKLKE